MKDLKDCSFHFTHKILHFVLRIIIEKILHCVQNDQSFVQNDNNVCKVCYASAECRWIQPLMRVAGRTANKRAG